MKSIKFNLIAFIALSFTFSLTSCLEDDCSEQAFFVEYEPIYVQPEQFRVDVKMQSARELEKTGKIYFYNNYIFINELYEGIHVIDNSNPSSPVNTAFINIPGNLDVAVKGNYMYADSYVDLLTIDISNFDDPVITCRDEDVFTYYNYHQEFGYFVYNKPTERQVAVDCSDPNFGERFFMQGNAPFLALTDFNNSGAPIVDASGEVLSSDTGVGGSLARFSIVNNFLYAINQTSLTAFNIETAEKPQKSETTYVSWNIETLFNYKEYLFIGASNGMYIYDMVDPNAPKYVSEFRHANACDPVFVKDDIAYVTLRNGNICQNFINQLDVLDVSNIEDPQLIASFDMDNPHGLSVRDNNLYLCEGKHGLKVFNIDNLEKINDNRIEHVKDINATDVISLNSNHLLLIGDGGLYQFNSEKPSDLKQLSYLSVKKQ